MPVYSHGQEALVDAFNIQLSEYGRTLVALDDSGIQFQALLSEQPPIDPLFDLGSDLREVTYAQILRPVPNLHPQVQLKDDSGVIWKWVKLIDNPSTITAILHLIRVVPEDSGGGTTPYVPPVYVPPAPPTPPVPVTRLINTAAPLDGGGDLSADRTISITQSGSNTDGYLSSADWGTFNAKQNSLGNLNGIIKGNGSNTYTVATSGTDYAPGYSGVPVGGIIAWAKSLTNTPALPIGYVECNGQTLSDAASVYNGVVIPNLNGSTDATKRFLRGATTSGGTGGSATHTHSVGSATDNHFITTATPIATAVTSVTTPTGSTSTIPTYYEVVYIMRTK
jgi:hypothetical protein